MAKYASPDRIKDGSDWLLIAVTSYNDRGNVDPCGSSPFSFRLRNASP